MRENKRKEQLLRICSVALVATIATGLAFANHDTASEQEQEPPVQSTEPAPIVDPAPMTDPVPVVQKTEGLGKFAIVAYCSCEKCCGRWAVDRPLDENGKEIVYTASGARAEAGVTVAVDPDVIPLGTDIYIDGMGWYKAQDTGAFHGKVIDVYFSNHEEACKFGRRNAEVSVVTADG